MLNIFPVLGGVGACVFADMSAHESKWQGALFAISNHLQVQIPILVHTLYLGALGIFFHAAGMNAPALKFILLNGKEGMKIWHPNVKIILRACFPLSPVLLHAFRGNIQYSPQ